MFILARPRPKPPSLETPSPCYNRIMKFLRKAFFILAYLMPAILFFSYYPLISLGKNATMNFELSLPLLWLVFFDLISFILLLSFYKNPRPLRQTGLSDKRFFLFSLFPLYATLSIFWSTNPLRSLLTAGVLWLTFFAVFALLFLFPLLKPHAHWRQFFLKSLFISAALVSAFCWLQSVLDLIGLARSDTLLCAGCTFWTFGFPHPSGFAIEPQFMGNLLLAPTLLAIYLLAFTDSSRPRPKSHQAWLWFFACFFSATLFLTLSRGAIYAFAVALFVLFLFALFRHRHWQPVIIIPVVTFFLTLTAQGIFSALSPTPDTFHSGVAKVVHQLSLGIIDIRPKAATPPTPSDSTADDNQAIFDGYIPASTNVRLGLNSLGLQTWLSSPKLFLVGAGLGGAGIAMHSAFPEHELALPNAIVQNEPISLLLELGLVGAILVIFSLLLAFCAPLFPPKFLDGRAVPATPEKLKNSTPETAKPTRALTRPLLARLRASVFWAHPALPLLLALIIAYLITLNFFSGLPNALQIYLMPPLLFLIFAKDPHRLIDE